MNRFRHIFYLLVFCGVLTSPLGAWQFGKRVLAQGVVRDARTNSGIQDIAIKCSYIKGGGEKTQTLEKVIRTNSKGEFKILEEVEVEKDYSYSLRIDIDQFNNYPPTYRYLINKPYGHLPVSYIKEQKIDIELDPRYGERQKVEREMLSQRVETIAQDAIINSDNAELKAAPSATAVTRSRLKKGENIEILWRSPTKETISGITAYWYGVSTQHSAGDWVHGSFLDITRKYHIPCNTIYGRSEGKSINQSEIDEMFPQTAFSIYPNLPIYSDLELTNETTISIPMGTKLTLLNRAKTGYPLNEYEGDGRKAEIFLLQPLPDYKLPTPAYIKATDIVRIDSTFSSPQGRFNFAEGVIGCAYTEIGGSFQNIHQVWLKRNNREHLPLGIVNGELKHNRIPLMYSPDDKHFVSAFHGETAIYDADGNRIASFPRTLAFPTWSNEGLVFFRGRTEADGVYVADLVNKTFKELFKLEGEYTQPPLGEGDMLPDWEPATFDPNSRTITATFVRPPGGYESVARKFAYTAITVKIDLQGNVIEKKSEKKFVNP